MIYTREACRVQEPGEASVQETACRALVDAHRLKCMGRAATRPVFQDLLQLARQGIYKVLVVYSVDRLTRSRGELEHILTAMNSAGVSVLTAEDGFSPLRPAAHRLEGLRGAFAHPGLSPKLVRSLHAAYTARMSTHDICAALNS